MKIAWFTPFWPESAIGTFSRHVTERLSRWATVELWVPQLAGSQDTHLDVVEFDPAALDVGRLRAADVVVYNFGNNLAFHQSIMLAARQVPGVVILHDLVLHQVFLDECRSRTGGIDEFLELVGRWYGPEAADEVSDSLQANPLTDYPPPVLAARFPLMEQAATSALGVVVHSAAQAECLHRWWVGPVAQLSLPSYEAEGSFSPPQCAARRPDGRLRLVSIGWVGPTKQIHRVIEALGEHPEIAARVSYRIAGPFDEHSEYGHELIELVTRYDLQDCVEFTGYLSDAELSSEIAAAEVFINLRWPSTEGGSAALAQQLISGRPVIVSRVGIFDEMPVDAVVKVAPDDHRAIAAAVATLIDAPGTRQQIGARGHETARAFTVEAYARGIAELLQTVPAWSPVLRTLDRLGDALGEIGAVPGLGVLQTLGSELSQIFGPTFSQGRTMTAKPSGAED